MAEVTVTISGRNYRMACDDGQEEHLQKLGVVVDQKIADMRASFGEIGDMRLTVMAGIVIADELAEAKRKIGELDEKIERMKSADAKGTIATDHDTAQAVEVVDHLAERLEILAADLRTRLKTTAGA
jgi:cell division protein ZapA